MKNKAKPEAPPGPGEVPHLLKMRETQGGQVGVFLSEISETRDDSGELQGDEGVRLAPLHGQEQDLRLKNSGHVYLST